MRIVLTGGGTGGHVVPNLAVIEELKKRGGHEILYIGSTDGPERALVEKAGVRFEAISCGKLRRYFSLKNVTDSVRFAKGIFEAEKLLEKFDAEVVFSKGGFVSLPVAIAAGRKKIPLILHESDLTPGLANKWAASRASKICVSFEESVEFFKGKKAEVVVTGSPIREEIFAGSRERGYKFTGLNDYRPVVLVMGGSQGAKQVNELIRGCLGELLKRFQVVHLCGRGNIDIGVKKDGYAQYEYLYDELKDVYAITDLVVTRGGANSLFEVAALGKRAVVVPLSTEGSRGDQVENAKVFVRRFGWSMLSGNVDSGDLLEAIEMSFRSEAPHTNIENGAKKIVDLILQK